MSIRDRLQGLVELLESKEKPEDELVDEIEKIEELIASEEEEKVEEVKIPDLVELTEEELENVYALRDAMGSAQLVLGQLNMNYEFQKVKIIKKYTQAQQALQDEVERLREIKGIPEGLEYSFTMPEKNEGSGFFKKEE